MLNRQRRLAGFARGGPSLALLRPIVDLVRTYLFEANLNVLTADPPNRSHLSQNSEVSTPFIVPGSSRASDGLRFPFVRKLRAPPEVQCETPALGQDATPRSSRPPERRKGQLQCPATPFIAPSTHLCLLLAARVATARHLPIFWAQALRALLWPVRALPLELLPPGR